MVREGEIEHGRMIAGTAESIWNWSSPAGRRRAERRAELIISGAELTPGMRVLELGCGTGLFTEKFVRSGAAVTAIDVSPDLLDLARQRTAWPMGVIFRLADAENLPFEAETFDAVVGSSVLHHLRIERAAAEVFRVLKPHGRIAFAEPNMLNPQIALQRNVPMLRRLAGESPEETAFVRWSLARLLREQGFAEVQIKPYDFLHPATPRVMIPLVQRIGRIVEALPVLREVAGSLIIQGRKSAVVSVRSRRKEGLLMEWQERARNALAPQDAPLPA
ncbi:MAG: class I SAM-dependent methyltransferase [Phycisphaerae bacterium]|nr:class I SAM-dependent methyltransferase [Phycisphaerae bacterium]